MSNYKDKQLHNAGKFKLEIHPYAAPPDNRFESGVALQYGADFKISFLSDRTDKTNLGLIQLIFPRTKLFPQTVVNAWNLDKHQRDLAAPIRMEQCLYGNAATKIGSHSEHYKGQNMQVLSATQCSLIDTPREIQAGFDKKGNFLSETRTKFANYVVALDKQTGIIFNKGIVWGYSVDQDSSNGANFDITVTPPREISLSDTSEHIQAIATFVGATSADVKSWINK